jgi:hypothetical protein
VRAGEEACPFCGARLALSTSTASTARSTARLGRAATFAFGAALTGLGASGCDDPDPAVDAGHADAGVVADAGGGGSDAGDRDDAGSSRPDAGGDAGATAADAGRDGGGLGIDSGGVDAGGVAPPYGAPPED